MLSLTVRLQQCHILYYHHIPHGYGSHVPIAGYFSEEGYSQRTNLLSPTNSEHACHQQMLQILPGTGWSHGVSVSPNLLSTSPRPQKQLRVGSEKYKYQGASRLASD